MLVHSGQFQVLYNLWHYSLQSWWGVDFFERVAQRVIAYQTSSSQSFSSEKYHRNFSHYQYILSHSLHGQFCTSWMNNRFYCIFQLFIGYSEIGNSWWCKLHFRVIPESL